MKNVLLTSVFAILGGLWIISWGAGQKYNYHDYVETKTEYLSDSVFVFSFWEKSPNAEGKIVTYPGLQCKVLDEESKTCELLNLVTVNEGDSAYVESDTVLDTPLVHFDYESLDTIPTGLVNGYTITKLNNNIGKFEVKKTVVLLTSREVGDCLAHYGQENIYLGNVDEAPEIYHDYRYNGPRERWMYDLWIYYTRVKQSVFKTIYFVGPKFKNWLPEITHDRYQYFTTAYIAAQHDEYGHYPWIYGLTIKCSQEMKEKIADIFYCSLENRPIDPDEVYYLYWFRYMREELVNENLIERL